MKKNHNREILFSLQIPFSHSTVKLEWKNVTPQNHLFFFAPLQSAAWLTSSLQFDFKNHEVWTRHLYDLFAVSFSNQQFTHLRIGIQNSLLLVPYNHFFLADFDRNLCRNWSLSQVNLFSRAHSLKAVNCSKSSNTKENMKRCLWKIWEKQIKTNKCKRSNHNCYLSYSLHFRVSFYKTLGIGIFWVTERKYSQEKCSHKSHPQIV